MIAVILVRCVVGGGCVKEHVTDEKHFKKIVVYRVGPRQLCKLTDDG